MSKCDHEQLQAILTADHVGQSKAISGEQLAGRLGVKVRTVRAWVLKLRCNAVAVCGSPESGYFVAATPAEVESTCNLLVAHAMHSLTVAARMRRTTLPELLGQLTLPTC